MKYCIYCGAKLSEGGKFCSRCGNPVYEVSTQQKTNFEEVSNSTVELESESEPTIVEQPVQSEENVTENIVTEDVAIHDDVSDDDGCVEEKNGGINKFAIVLCSIALLLVIAFAFFKVESSKPKYRIVYPTQTTQSAQKSNDKKNDVQTKKADSAKNKNAVSTSEQLVYSVATDGFVYVRELPNADSETIGVLATNRKGAKLISDKDTWWKVRIDTVVGYVNSKYVKLSDTPVKISGLPKVYYVVLESHSTLDSAQMYNYVCPDGMECWIYKCTAKGRTVYRVCDGCFSTRSKAQAAINEWRSTMRGDWYTNAWIWESEGLGDCVFCPGNYETERTMPPLTPE